LGENKKHKTDAQNKKLLGMYTTTTLSQANAQNKILFSTYTTTLSRANAQNKILFSTYTTTLSQANAQWIKSLSKELWDIKLPLCS
jgi:hypothetical protein